MTIININNLPEWFDKERFISEEMKDISLSIEFIYESYFKNSKVLRDFVEIIWLKLNLPHSDMARFILVVDELNNNAIEYWSEEWWENKLRINICNNWDELGVCIEVEDTWKWLKHKNALEMETLRAHQLKLWYGNHESIRGRGLFMIIVKSVDRLYFKDSDNWWLIVWIRKNVKI